MESKVMETLDRLSLCSTSANAPTLEARKALLAAAVEDKTAHDRRIAELEAALMKDRVTHCQSIGAKNARIAELEASASGLHTRALQAEADLRNTQAELAKRELPPLPEDVRVIVDQLRRSHITNAQTHTLITFIDAMFPKPVPKWEQYAQWVESLESTMSPIGYAYAKKVARFIRESGAKGE